MKSKLSSSSLFIFVSAMVFFLMVCFVSANLEIFDIKNEYNYGEDLVVKSTIQVGEDFDGFYKLRLTCDDYSQDIYLVPIHLKQNEKKTVENDPLVITDRYGDNCRVSGFLLDDKGHEEESSETESFDIISALVFDFQIDKTHLKPGDKVNIVGKIDSIRSDFENVDINIIFNKKILNMKSSEKDFEYLLTVPDDISSGEYDIVVEIKDEFGNRDQVSKRVSVTGEAKSIFINVQKANFSVGEIMQYKVVLFETSGKIDEIKPVDVKIINPIGMTVFENSVRSTDKLSYTFLEDNYGGVYTISASYNDLKEEREVNLKNEENLPKNGLIEIGKENVVEEIGSDEDVLDEALTDISGDEITTEGDETGQEKGWLKLNYLYVLLAMMIIIIAMAWYMKIQKKKGDKIFGTNFGK